MHTRHNRRIQTELTFTLAKNATKPKSFEIISLQTTRKENNWKTEETLARAVITLQTERIKRVQFFYVYDECDVFLLLCLCIFIVTYVLFCIFCFHRANWHSSATLTEDFPCFFLSCKANARV